MINKQRILVLEDDQDHIALINILNNEFKFDIDVGNSIFDFLRFIKDSKYDLILCDLNLHYQSEGLDILKSFHSHKLDSKIFAYTSNSNEENFFIEKGFNGVIRKNLGELKQLFNNLILNKSLRPTC